ncbi:hypothetical protein TNCV_3132751 [Trichonephila clavipes]|nr:hypothetical protein TNCV_3132751 [Trichonephila clavipes]
MRLKSSHIYGIRGILILQRGLKKNWISADRHEDEREVAGTGSFLHARNNMYFCSVSGSDCFDKISPNYRQSQFGVDNNATATAYVLKKVCIAKFKNLRTYYRNEKQKLSSFRSGTGAMDLVPKWEHFACLQFLDDTIQPLDPPQGLTFFR